MSQAQNQQAQVNVFTEERFFPIDMDRNYELLEAALRDALGVELEPVTHGMWFAKHDSTAFGETEITVRMTPAEGGTSVHITIQRHAKPMGIVAGTVFLIPALMTVIPFVLWLAKVQQDARKQTRKRMVTMHKIWTELARAVGAPKRAGYRGAPKRARIYAEEEEGQEEEAVEAKAEVEVEAEAEQEA